MNKYEILYQLNNILEKLDNCKRFPKIPQITGNELKSLKEVIDYLKDEDKRFAEIKEDYEKKLRFNIQKHCDHAWGRENWTWSCGGYRVCTKCGKVEDFYERD